MAIRELILILQHKPRTNIQNDYSDNLLILNCKKNYYKENTIAKINSNKITLNTTKKIIKK